MSLPVDYSGKIQTDIFNLEHWPTDENYENYPVGARPKMAFFPPSDLDITYIQNRRRYLLKGSDKRYPDQFWAEIVAYHVGCLLGVVVPPAFAAYYPNFEFSGALIEWFYIDGQSAYVAAGDFMLQLITNYDRKSGNQHNFHDIQILCKVFARENIIFGDWKTYWGETFLFDALIGNTDRHQDNWGFIFQDGGGKITPLFDNGTSLGNERFPNKLASWTDNQFDAYIKNGTHHVKWQLNDGSRANHFSLIQQVIANNEGLKQHLYDMISGLSIESLACILELLKKVSSPIPLSAERADLILKLTIKRKNILIDILT